MFDNSFKYDTLKEIAKQYDFNMEICSKIENSHRQHHHKDESLIDDKLIEVKIKYLKE